MLHARQVSYSEDRSVLNDMILQTIIAFAAAALLPKRSLELFKSAQASNHTVSGQWQSSDTRDTSHAENDCASY